MNPIANLIQELKRKKIKLSLTGNDKLNVIADKGIVTASLLAQIKENKAAIIEFIRKHQSTTPKIPKANPAPFYPASFAQKRMWLTSLLSENNNAYVIARAIKIKGDFYPEVLQSTAEKIVERHETLRTVFREGLEEGIEQLVLPIEEVNFKIDFIDLESVSLNTSTLENQIKQVRSQNFDLSQWPLFRLTLIKQTKKEFVLILQMHHIISDGWSVGVLMKEIFQYYNARIKENKLSLNPLRIQYKDYSLWQRGKQASEEVQLQEQFWTNMFAEEVPVLDLTTDYPRPSIQTYQGAKINTSVDENTLAAFKSYCQDREATLFMGLVAVMNILLYRYTAQEDIVIGSPVACRDNPELEDQIGLYVNTLAIRNEIKEEESFEEFLLRVKDHIADLFKYQDYPFDKVVENASQKRDITRNPLFDLMLILQEETTLSPNILSNATIETYELKEDTVQFDLVFECRETNGVLSLHTFYNTSIFKSWRITAMQKHFAQLLKQLTATPKIPVSQVDYLGAEEKEKILNDFKGETRIHKEADTILDLWNHQVQTNSDKIILKYEKENYTVAELEKRSNQLANYLLSNFDVQTEELVILKLPRSEWIYIGILAILKTGAAYVPVDCKYPKERIDFILQDSKSKIVLDVELLQSFVKSRDTYSPTAPEIRCQEHNLAYIIYTSGSTGKPKGVMIEHRSAVAFFQSLDADFGINSSRKVLASTNYIFDISVLELLGTLVNGICSVMIEGEPDEILQLIANGEVDVLQCTPSRLMQLLEMTDGNLTPLQKLKILLVGGEAFTDKLYDLLKQGLPNTQTINGYGPSECTIYSSSLIFNGSKELSIGTPQVNGQIYILDKQNNLCPIGRKGEICIGGVCQARGYLNRPELTAERFIPNPFEAGTTIYRSGDIGWWLPDGNIKFVGRNDHQVKIRGYRIELGEIENALSEIESLTAAVVEAKNIQDGTKVLVAYFMAEKEIDSTSLKAELTQKLPEYMVPALFIQVPEMPMTASGKVDRKALPDISGKNILKHSYRPPANELQATLVKIWEAILGINKIGIDDEFFELGGDSIKATRLIMHVLRREGKRMSIREVFLHSTIKKQSEFLISQTTELLKPIPKIEQKPDYAVSDAQLRLWLLTQIESDLIAYNAYAAYKVSGQLNLSVLKRSFQKIVERHEILRTSFKETDGVLRQVVHASKDLGLELEIVDWSADSKTAIEVEEEIESLSQELIDLEKGPLLKSVLFVLSDKEYYFFNMFHHIISDGWSIGIFIKELFHNYNTSLEGVSPELPSLPIQYKDYAEWQIRQQHSAEVLFHQEYWIEQFKERVSPLDIPVDLPRPLAQSYNGLSLKHTFSNATFKTFRQFCKEQEVTLFAGLLSILKVLLYHYTRQSDIVIGSPSAGRVHPDLEHQIGLYINLLPLRTRFAGKDTFAQLLSTVSENSLNAFKHQTYSFEKLVEQLNLPRDLSRHPLFDVMMVLQEQSNSDLQASAKGLQLEEYHFKNSFAQFDLTFDFSEEPGGLVLKLSYNSDIYKKWRMEAMINHFDQLLEIVAINSNQAIQNIDFLTTAEKEKVKGRLEGKEWNPKQDISFLDLFSQQCRKTPDRQILFVKNKSFSYRELDQMSNQFAHYLSERFGIGLEERIVLKLPRTEWMTLSILAVLKSGACYIPIDPNYPPSRVEYILEDSQSKLTIDLDTIQDFINNRSKYKTSYQKEAVKPNNLAYIIYTSGSTGKPKGVMIEHRNLVSFFENLRPLFKLNEEQLLLATTNYTFDISVLELLGTLGHGVPYFLAEGEPEEMLELIAKEKITALQLTPSKLLQLLEFTGEDLTVLKNLEVLLVGGEALSEKMFYLLKNQLTDSHLVNVYGPTETTIWSTCLPLHSTENLSIGNPLFNEQILILDAQKQLVPIGVKGEIYITGEGLARGYWNRPKLTKEKFVDHAFLPQKKMYRTGDLGVLLPNGSIQFAGRVDHQVKIRGHRIELGEIENAILKIKGISGAVVVAKKIKGALEELVAYFTSKEEIDAALIRQHLAQNLPQYMVPSYFVYLEDIPLNSSGKVDRKKLPSISEEDLITREYRAPSNEIEVQLEEFWKEVLALNKVGVDDNFFEIGGDSLKATRLVGVINKKSKFKLSTKEVFNLPTIAQQAKVLFQRVASKSTVQRDSINKLPLNNSQQSFLKKEGQGLHNSWHYMLLPAETKYDELTLKQSVEILCDFHDALNIELEFSSEGVFQKNKGDQRKINFMIFDWTNDSKGKDKMATTIDDFFKLSNWRKELLFKTALFRMFEEDVFFIAIHQMVADAFSWKIILEDFRDIYQALANQKPVKKQNDNASFADWSVYLSKREKQGKFKADKKYWESVDLTEARLLPKQKLTAVNENTNNATIVFDKAYTKLLTSKANEAYQTKSQNLLLLAMSRAAQRCFEISKLGILFSDFERFNDSGQIEVDRTVGCMSLYYPMIIAMDSATDLSKQIKTVKEIMHQVPNAGISYLPMKEVANDMEMKISYYEDFHLPYELHSLSEQKYPVEITIHLKDEELALSYCQTNDNGFDLPFLMKATLEELKKIIDHCIAKDKQELTPSDFDYKDLTIDELENLENIFS